MHFEHSAFEAAVCQFLESKAPEITKRTIPDPDWTPEQVLIVTDDAAAAEGKWRQTIEDNVLPAVVVIDDATSVDLALSESLMMQFQRSMNALQLATASYAGLVGHIQRELATFYHNINNPLTILSGNLQLLELIASSVDVPADVTKPIQDIAGITGRFEQDLKQIMTLREKIKDFSIKKDLEEVDMVSDVSVD